MNSDSDKERHTAQSTPEAAPSQRDLAARHERARELHEAAALRHEEGAEFWDEHGDPELADLERRNARLEREAAELEADRARLHHQRRRRD